MIVDQGITCRAINLDAGLVLVVGPDGKHQLCKIAGWFGVSGAKVSGPELALTFAFEVHGFSKEGFEVTQRYDAMLEGLGDPIPRNPDGSFGNHKAAARVEREFLANPAREAIPTAEGEA